MKVLHRSLDDLMKNNFQRLWSATSLPGYVPDILYGGYCESDELLRQRIKKELGRTQ